jgi:hypothetical protein
VIVALIDAHRAERGVEPICEQLQVAPSTYYAHRARPPSARAVTDAATTARIEHVAMRRYSSCETAPGEPLPAADLRSHDVSLGGWWVTRQRAPSMASR